MVVQVSKGGQAVKFVNTMVNAVVKMGIDRPALFGLDIAEKRP